MVPLSQFYSRLLPHTPTCPEPLMAQAVLDSAIEFCDRSLVTRVRLDPQSVVAGQDTYEIETPSQQRVSVVTNVWLDKRLLAPAPQDSAVDIGSPSSWPDRYYTKYVDGSMSLVLYPTPDRDLADGLVLEIATRPDRSAQQVDSALYNDWAEAIVHGALFRLHLIPNQPFTDGAKAEVHGRLMVSMAGKARTESLHGRSQVGLSVTMRSF